MGKSDLGERIDNKHGGGVKRERPLKEGNSKAQTQLVLELVNRRWGICLNSNRFEIGVKDRYISSLILK